MLVKPFKLRCLVLLMRKYGQSRQASFFTGIATFIVIYFFNLIFQIRSDNGFDDEEFKGFLVQARNAADNKAVGRFILPNNDGESRMQHLSCIEDQKEVIFQLASSLRGKQSSIIQNYCHFCLWPFMGLNFSVSVQKGPLKTF